MRDAWSRLFLRLRAGFVDRVGLLFTAYVVLGPALSVRTPLSWIVALILFLPLLCFISLPPAHRSKANEFSSEIWSTPTTQGTGVFLLTSTAGLLSFNASADVIKAISVLAFAAMVGSAAYLRNLLRGPSFFVQDPNRLEALKLEHHACIVISQTVGTMLAVLFIGLFISPLLTALQNQTNKTIWVVALGFYTLAGYIVWLIRPPLEWAMQIRQLLSSQGAEERGDGV